MNLPKILIYFSLFLFGVIGLVALFQNGSTSSQVILTPGTVEIELNNVEENRPVLALREASHITMRDEKTIIVDLPDADRIDELFNKEDPRLPIVETITYKSHVTWLKGRPAWLSDYATHYATSRHFIARSLNGKVDYDKQELAEGEQFNILRQDKHFTFDLIVDTSRCRLWLYYTDLDSREHVLLKTYSVCLGRLSAAKTSGLLTPLGKYSLGKTVAIYKPKMMGIYQGKNTEMITIFGTRWIPFANELHGCTAPARGFGIHGVPLVRSTKGLMENTSSIGKYESDGCIRLKTSDIEELFAIITTRSATIQIVRDFTEYTFP